MVLLGVSCIRDEYPTGPEASGDGREVTVELRLQTADGLFGGTRSATRSNTTEWERTVADALVLFFHESGSTMTLYSVAEGRNLTAGGQSGTPGDSSTAVTTGTVTFQANFTVDAKYLQDNFTCIVLTNVREATLVGESTPVLSALQAAVGESYQQIQSRIALAVESAPQADSPAYIPMYGRATSSLIPSTAPTQRLTVPLIRSLARVQLYNTATADFTLTEAYIFRATNRMALLPLADAFGSSTSPNVVTKPSIPSRATALASTDPWKYEVSNPAAFEETIYLPEADTHGDAGPGAAPGDLNHTKRCAVVVGGSYQNGATSYYRIDFTTTTGQERTLLDVLRNHSYNITISAVKSAGAASPEEAYNSQSTNIDASVIEWTDENQEMVFDGSNWASVSRKQIAFSSGADLTAQLNVKSNVKPSEWRMLLDGATSTRADAEPSTDATVSGTYFSVTRPADSADDATYQGGDLEIRTLQANTTSTETPEGQITPGETYHETLHIYIGRLELVIELAQKPYEDTQWEDGGRFEGEF